MLMPLIAAVAVFVLGFLTAWRVSAALDYGFWSWALVIVGALVIAASRPNLTTFPQKFVIMINAAIAPMSEWTLGALDL